MKLTLYSDNKVLSPEFSSLKKRIIFMNINIFLHENKYFFHVNNLQRIKDCNETNQLK